MRLRLPAHVVARFHVLRTRQALPAWVLAGLALIGRVADVWAGGVVLWRWAQSVPLLSSFTTSTGLLIAAMAWIGWLLLRPSSVETAAVRLQRVRRLLREAAVAIRTEADRLDAAKNPDEVFSGGYEYVQTIDMLDDACVAPVKVAYDEFMKREERMYRAADVSFSHLRATAGYLERLADRLTITEIDPGFRLPESFADWCKGHQPNVRPVE